MGQSDDSRRALIARYELKAVRAKILGKNQVVEGFKRRIQILWERIGRVEVPKEKRRRHQAFPVSEFSTEHCKTADGQHRIDGYGHGV